MNINYDESSFSEVLTHEKAASHLRVKRQKSVTLSIEAVLNQRSVRETVDEAVLRVGQLIVHEAGSVRVGADATNNGEDVGDRDSVGKDAHLRDGALSIVRSPVAHPRTVPGKVARASMSTIKVANAFVATVVKVDSGIIGPVEVDFPAVTAVVTNADTVVDWGVSLKGSTEVEGLTEGKNRVADLLEVDRDSRTTVLEENETAVIVGHWVIGVDNDAEIITVDAVAGDACNKEGVRSTSRWVGGGANSGALSVLEATSTTNNGKRGG